MKRKKIYVAGHNGMVGSALIRKLKKIDACDLITKNRNELDLTDQKAVQDFFQSERPNEVYLAAAKVGGIEANNTLPADFIYQNLMIESNIIHSSLLSGTKKLLFLGSSCIYPRLSPQPIKEEYLLTGLLEPTNEPYAIAKIAGIKLCESYNRQYGHSHGISYRSIMPTNLYGPGDNYHPQYSHVIPALIKKFHDAKIEKSEKVTIWGSGEPRREFLHVDDMASACIHLMNLSDCEYERATSSMCSHVNAGSGKDLSIRELAEIIKEITGYQGQLHFDSSRPDGSPQKLMDSSRINSLGWEAEIPFKAGLTATYEDFKINYK